MSFVICFNFLMRSFRDTTKYCTFCRIFHLSHWSLSSYLIACRKSHCKQGTLGDLSVCLYECILLQEEVQSDGHPSSPEACSYEWHVYICEIFLFQSKEPQIQLAFCSYVLLQVPVWTLYQMTPLWCGLCGSLSPCFISVSFVTCLYVHLPLQFQGAIVNNSQYQYFLEKPLTVHVVAFQLATSGHE